MNNIDYKKVHWVKWKPYRKTSMDIRERPWMIGKGYSIVNWEDRSKWLTENTGINTAFDVCSHLAKIEPNCTPAQALACYLGLTTTKCDVCNGTGIIRKVRHEHD